MRRAFFVVLAAALIAVSLGLALRAAATSGAVNQSITSDSTLTGTVHWQAYPDGHRPPRVDFYVDGNPTASDASAPYCFGSDVACAIDTQRLANGTHRFKVVYLDSVTGSELASDTATATVDNTRPTTTGSWNPHVTRWPVVTTTISYLKGDGTEAGGGFPNHLTDFYPVSLTRGQPLPSEIPDNFALVELDDVVTTPVIQRFGAGINDGDGVDALVDPRAGVSLHSEISRAWGTIEMPDGSIRGPFLDPYPAQTVWPPAGTHLDVQGFVRWDVHNSWWELHPVSAWRIHSTGAASTGETTSIRPQTLSESILAQAREEASDSR